MPMIFSWPVRQCVTMAVLASAVFWVASLSLATGAPNRRRMCVDGNSDFIVHVGPTLTSLRGFLQAVVPPSRLVKLLWKLVEENDVHNIIVTTPNGGSSRRVKMVNADAQLTLETVTSHLLNHADLQDISTQTTPVVVVHSPNQSKLAVSLCIMGNILSGIREDTRVDVIGLVSMFLRCCPDVQFTQSDLEMFHDFAQQCIQRTDPANTYANIRP